MDPADLETFLVLADELHFGRAAERAQLSRERVGQRIAALEAHIGAPLFERTRRRVVLTPLGARLAERLRPAFAELGDAVAEAREHALELTGPLRIGRTAAAGERYAEVVRAFRAAYPTVEVVELDTDPADPLDGLRAGRLDVLVHWLSGDEPELVLGPPIGELPRELAVVADHPFASLGAVSTEQLVDYDVEVAESSEPGAPALLPSHTRSGRPIARHPITAPDELAALAASGRAVVPVLPASRALFGRDVVFVPVSDLPPLRYGPLWRRERENARIRAFAEFARTLPG